MQCYSGKIVYKGIAMGPVVVLKKSAGSMEATNSKDVNIELERVEKAMALAKEQLQDICDKARIQVGEENAAIFEIHRMLLEDEGYLKAIQNTIQAEQVNAETAVESAGAKLAEMFAAMDDENMKARAADIKDISTRIMSNLCGQKVQGLELEVPSVIVADELTPSETIQLDKEKILAFVTIHGSANSHAAILARMMNIPTLIGVPMELPQIKAGMPAVVDAMDGRVIFEPDATACLQAEQKIREEQEKLKLLQEMKGLESATVDGHKVGICGNIGSVNAIDDVLENDGEGIGLFRSEFLYLGRNSLPTEEEQYQVYRQAVERMQGKKVVIRTMDVGADKQLDFFKLEKEENPALGYRGIRISLNQPEVFKTQLRALLRAAAHGNLGVLYPMITSVEEVRQIAAIVAEVQAELESQGVPYKVPMQGLMIETPAAVMMSDELAEMVDFFSIGTNDLTQYTLAVDRQNERLEKHYNPQHKAILRMIQMVVNNAHEKGKRVSICGELGADLTLTESLVRMGVDELSVSPSMILQLRKVIRELVIQ